MFRFAGFHITLFEQEIVIPALIIFLLVCLLRELFILKGRIMCERKNTVRSVLYF